MSYCGKHSFHYGTGTARDNCPDCKLADLQKKVDRLTKSNTALLNSKHKSEKEAKLWFDRFQALKDKNDGK